MLIHNSLSTCSGLMPRLSQQGYPLRWKQDNGTILSGGALSGRSVRARVYMRKATVFSLGAGNTWSNQITLPVSD